jgi:dihydrodipicolinate synthase/N-acetylneuraminate lyase
MPTRAPYASLCTPFDPSGRVDLRGIAALVEFGLSHGVEGFLCTALAGEVDQLSHSERREVIRTVLGTVDDRVPVIVGLGSGPLADALLLGREAEAYGASGVMFPALAEWEGVEAEALRAVEALAEAVSVDLMLQEAPSYSPARFGWPVLGRIAEESPDRISIKVEGGSRVLEDACRLVDVPLWGGDGGLYLLECLRAGAVGVIPGVEIVDTLAHAQTLELYGFGRDAEKLHDRALPYLILAMQSLASYVASAKRVLVARGVLRSVGTRLPGSELSVRAAAAVDRAYALLAM